MNPFLYWILLLVISLSAFALPPKVRRISLAPDDIATVKTALGIATIIQVPDRPNSVVVGDLEAFKVEYLDQAITIKPIHSGVKSNLYVYTDYRRFNVQLVSSNEESADYVVYLDNPKEKSTEVKSSLSWTPFGGRLTNDALAVRLKRLGRSRDSVLIVEFEISSGKQEALKPEWFWLTQNGVTRPIQNLFLSDLVIKSSDRVQGVLQIQRADIDASLPMRLEVRRKKTSFITIPKVTSWK